MISTDQTVDSRPIENPERIVVAGPVTVDSVRLISSARRGDTTFARELEEALARRRPSVDSLLASYGVPVR